MRTHWTTKGNRDTGSSCSYDQGLHRYVWNFGGGGCLNTPTPPSVRNWGAAWGGMRVNYPLCSYNCSRQTRSLRISRSYGVNNVVVQFAVHYTDRLTRRKKFPQVTETWIIDKLECRFWLLHHVSSQELRTSVLEYLEHSTTHKPFFG